MCNFIGNSSNAPRPSYYIYVALSAGWQRHAPAASWIWRWCNCHAYSMRQSSDPSTPLLIFFVFHENINENQQKINKAIINWRILKSCSCWCHPQPISTPSFHIPEQTRPSPGWKLLKISSVPPKKKIIKKRADCDLLQPESFPKLELLFEKKNN